jgi:hypothetical protein
MIYNTIHHDIRNKAKLSLIDWCLLESIYQLSVNPKARYKTWCNASKNTFKYLASDRTILTRLNKLEKGGWIEFKEGQRMLKRTTKKYYSEVYAYVLGTKKLRIDHEETSHQTTKKLRTRYEETSPNNNKDNNTNKDKDKKETKHTPKNSENWTKLDINLHNYKMPFSDKLNASLLNYWKYMEEKKGRNWGTKTTIVLQVDFVHKFLKTFTEEEIAASLLECMSSGNSSYNPEWTKNRNKKMEPVKQKYSFNTKISNA